MTNKVQINVLCFLYSKIKEVFFLKVNKYEELINRQQSEYNKFPIKFAFNDKQFRQSMNELGLTEKDTDKIVSIGAGGFMRKTDVDAYLKLGNKFAKEMEEAIENDKTGRGFVKDMFAYELANHEYGYTRVLTDTLDALGYKVEDINSNPKLMKGLKLALNEYSIEMEEAEM